MHEAGLPTFTLMLTCLHTAQWALQGCFPVSMGQITASANEIKVEKTDFKFTFIMWAISNTIGACDSRVYAVTDPCSAD